VIEPVGRALGIRVERVEGLPQLADARGALEAFLRR
jgi:hypothetical protein